MINDYTVIVQYHYNSPATVGAQQRDTRRGPGGQAAAED